MDDSSGYKCDRCGKLVDYKPIPLESNTLRWYLCEFCFEDYLNFVSPDNYNYTHQRCIEAMEQLQAQGRLFEVVTKSHPGPLHKFLEKMGG